MKEWLVILICCALMVFNSCGSGTKGAAEVTVEEAGGVTYVHNPAVPLHPEKKAEFEKELTIQPEDTEGNILYSRPEFFLADDKGFIYIADVQENDFKVFNPEGKLVRTLGASGSGPGEFQNIGAGGFTPDGKLVVLDPDVFRTSIFEARGDFLQDFRWDHKYGGLHLVKQGSYVTQEFVPKKEGTGYGLFLVELDFDGNEIRTYGEFSPPESRDVVFDGKAFGMPIPRSPESVFAGDTKTGRLYHCHSSEYRIEVNDSGGKLSRVIDRPYSRPAFTAAEKRAIQERIESEMQGKMGSSAPKIQVPSLKPVTAHMVVDEAGNLWVATNENREEGGTELTAVDIFDTEGRYNTRLWLEYEPGLFKNGKMYRFAVDDMTGYTSLVRYSVSWN